MKKRFEDRLSPNHLKFNLEQTIGNQIKNSS